MTAAPEHYFPPYEGRMAHQFNHRFALLDEMILDPPPGQGRRHDTEVRL